MIGFVEAGLASGMIPISRIVSISEARANAHGVPLHRVKLEDGSTFDTFESDQGGLLRRPVQISPAEPGTSIIRVDGADEHPKAWRTRVIAWALCLDGEVRPVTPNGVCDAIHGRVYVELADGSVEAVGEWEDPCGFKDADEMVAHFRAKGVYSGDRR